MSDRRDPVVATCITCGWCVSGSTWRPVKRALREHAARKHPDLVPV